MKHTKSLMVLAGASLGLSSVALAQQSADDTAARNRELQSDASARSSFQADTGGPTINFSGFTQFQYNVNWRKDDGKNTGITGGNSITNGFRFAKTKLIATGNVTDEWTYRLQGAFATEGGDFALEDMYASYMADNGWEVQAGEKKLPFMHEELVSDTGQQGAERSVINDKFSTRRGEGIFLNYKADEFRFMGAFDDGAATNNSEFTDSREADWAFTARGEYKWAGEWDRFDQFSSWNSNEMAGMAGLAGHYQKGGDTVGTFDESVYGATADVAIQGAGWNVAAAAVWSTVSPNVGDDVSDLGLNLQGGIFVTDDWELFGRGNYVFSDNNKPERDDFWTITGGANWFITPMSQNAKFTIEVIYAGEQQVANNGALNLSPSEDTGVLSDAEGGQFTVRGQLQIKF